MAACERSSYYLLPKELRNSMKELIIFKTHCTKYWISKKAYEEEEVKVKDQDHITGKYQGSAHVM